MAKIKPSAMAVTYVRTNKKLDVSALYIGDAIDTGPTFKSDLTTLREVEKMIALYVPSIGDVLEEKLHLYLDPENAYVEVQKKTSPVFQEIGIPVIFLKIPFFHS
jgi:hypothetical protein